MIFFSKALHSRQYSLENNLKKGDLVVANSYKIGTISHCHTSHLSARKSDKNAPTNALLSFFFQWI